VNFVKHVVCTSNSQIKCTDGHANIPPKEGDLGKCVARWRANSKIGSLDSDLQTILEDMGVKLNWEQHLWDNMFEQLKEFKAQHGHCKVVRNNEYAALNSWVVTQRLNYHEGKMSQDVKDKLNEIGFIWSVKRKNANSHLEQLKAFKEEHGHWNVRDEDNSGLSKWVSHLRCKFRDGTLDPVLKASLEEMEFDFAKPLDHRVRDHINELRAFKEEHGHCEVYGHGYNNLSKWLSTVRCRFKAGTLEKELEEELEELGLEFLRWDVSFKQLKSYYEQYGHYDVNRSVNDHNYRQLITWVKNQKLEYKEGNLSQERIARLEEIEFDWNIEDNNEANVEDRSRKKWKDRQEEMIEQLKAFKEQHGRIPLFIESLEFQCTHIPFC
jgi:hypothetical protein